MTSNNYNKEFEIAKDIIKKVGAFLISNRNNITVVNRKEGFRSFDFSTSQDLAAEKMIVDAIHKTFPNDQILSEETLFETDMTQDRFWIIDPIDGTKRYANGSDVYFVSISLCINHVIEFSVVYRPSCDELISSRKDLGVTKNGEKIILMNKDQKIKDSLIHFGYPHHRSKQVTSIYHTMKDKILHASRDTLRSACAVFDTVELAAGAAGAHILPDTKLWDAAFGISSAKEQGLIISDPFGKPLDPFRTVNGESNFDVIFAKPQIHKPLIEITSKYFEQLKDLKP